MLNLKIVDADTLQVLYTCQTQEVPRVGEYIRVDDQEFRINKVVFSYINTRVEHIICLWCVEIYVYEVNNKS